MGHACDSIRLSRGTAWQQAMKMRPYSSGGRQARSVDDLKRNIEAINITNLL